MHFKNMALASIVLCCCLTSKNIAGENTVPFLHYDNVPDLFRNTIQNIHNAPLPLSWSQVDLESEIEEIAPCEFYWIANSLESYDLKDGMYVGLLKNRTSIFIKTAKLESTIGEILTNRLFNFFDETKSIVPPLKVFQLNSPFQLTQIFYNHEEGTVTHHPKPAAGERSIGTPFIKNSKIFIHFLEDHSQEEERQFFRLEEKLRLTNLLQAILGVGDNHLANYLWNAGSFFKIDNENAIDNQSFEVVKRYAFKPLALPEEGENFLRSQGLAWDDFLKEKYTFSKNFIRRLESLEEHDTWQTLLDFTLWDGTKGSQHYNIQAAIDRVFEIKKNLIVA